MSEATAGGHGELHGSAFGSVPGAGILADPSLGMLQRLLLTTDGTVVRLLEGWFGEPVRAVEIAQCTVPAPPGDPVLETSGYEKTLRRNVLLQTRDSGRTLLHAASSIVLDRVPPAVRDGLLAARAPIGRVLIDNRVETFKELLRMGRRRAGSLSAQLDVDVDDELLYRTYRVLSGGHPIMLITETFAAVRSPGWRDAPDRGGREAITDAAWDHAAGIPQTCP